MDKEKQTEKDVVKSESIEQPVEISPKDARKASIKAKYARYANVVENKLRGNATFGREASNDLQDAFSEANLADGSNPSAKYLVQHLLNQDDVSVYKQLIEKLSPDEEFIGQGKGAEYGLDNGLAVNKLDYTKFIPQSRNDMGKYTYWDTIELSADPDDFDKVEVSIAPYLYVQYYLSGELDKLVAIIKPKLNQAFVRNQARLILELIQKIFRMTMAKTGTAAANTNHLAGTTTLSQVDAVKEFLDFIYPMGFDNTKFNYGYDTYDSTTSAWVHNDYTDAYNSCPESERIYICEYQTYNNLKKYATTFLSSAEINDYFKMDKWIVLPTSIYNNATASPSTKGTVDQLVTLSTVSGTTVSRTAGAVLVMDRRALKRVYNLSYETSEYYAPNMTTQIFGFKNWAIKFLKWGQVAVYNNSALESAFVVPTTTA